MKKLIIGVLLLAIITIVCVFIYMKNFELFDEPKEVQIKTECDFEGLRKITMFELKGNATTNNSLLIKSSDCNVELYSDDLINS